MVQPTRVTKLHPLAPLLISFILILVIPVVLYSFLIQRNIPKYNEYLEKRESILNDYNSMFGNMQAEILQTKSGSQLVAIEETILSLQGNFSKSLYLLELIESEDLEINNLLLPFWARDKIRENIVSNEMEMVKVEEKVTRMAEKLGAINLYKNILKVEGMLSKISITSPNRASISALSTISGLINKPIVSGISEINKLEREYVQYSNEYLNALENYHSGMSVDIKKARDRYYEDNNNLIKTLEEIINSEI